MNVAEERSLEQLSAQFPSAEAASARIAELNAALELPKSTEFFVSDIHGELAGFTHTLRNGCGQVRKLIASELGDLPQGETEALATLICYPEQKLQLELSRAADAAAWLKAALPRLACVAKAATVGHAPFQVRALLPADLADEALALMDGSAAADAAAASDRAGDLVVVLGNLIQRLMVGHVHVVGDIYDRGPYPEKIMDELIALPSADVQWGNHDIVWMGAALGQRGCICHVVRACARYANMGILEDSYGMDLAPLYDFAMRTYADDPCAAYGLKGNPDLSEEETLRNVKVQKAMSMIMYKVEAALIDQYPEFGLQDRKLLHTVDLEKGTFMVDGIECELLDKEFPTVDWSDPYALTSEEEAVMQSLEQAFLNCSELQRHMRFFLDQGDLYRVSNGVLMFHACVPLNDDGSLRETNVFGKVCKGKQLFDEMGYYVHQAFDGTDLDLRQRGRDLMWYLWLGPGSPLFAKSKMATFERYLTTDKQACKEVKNAYYSLLEDESVLAGIFQDFGLDPRTSHIVSGHTPVKVKDGADPVKCGGRAMIIDGGFSAAYQKTTGIAGFTLANTADDLVLYSHMHPLESVQAAVERNLDIESQPRVVVSRDQSVTVGQSDEGREIRNQIAALQDLAAAYETGEIQPQ